MPEGKSLHDTMQESPNEKFKEDPPCKYSCVPYWQPTGERRCLDIGVVEIEEADGCCNLRFTRITDPVVWEFNDQERCDESRNRIERQQVNQCGGTRWVSTAELCCTPAWVPSEEGIDCSQSMERRYEEDGCGNTRLRSTGHPVNWVGTGEVRCEPGDIYQIEQTNQCGDTRWFTVPGGCPCIPDWQPLGPQRCTGAFIENQEADGCGHQRWQPTATAVVWTNTGETRCNGGFIQNEQISQCGTTRWFTTETPCSISPPANELDPKYESELLSGPGKKFMSCRISATTGTIHWGQGVDGTFTDGGEQSEQWVTGAFARGDYEARITYSAAEPPGTYREIGGSTLDTWFDLGDTTQLSFIMTCTETSWPLPNQGIVTVWNNVVVRIDIRKKNESISGGCTFGPFTLRAT